MKTNSVKKKAGYLAPEIKVFEHIPEGVLCKSGNTEDYTDGEIYDDDDFNS